MREIASERIGLPVSYDNDATTWHALAENLYGAARGTEDAVMLTTRPGIGGRACPRQAKVYRGSTGAGRRVGHTVVEFDGPAARANCPGRGCIGPSPQAPQSQKGREAAEREQGSALAALKAEGREIDR